MITTKMNHLSIRSIWQFLNQVKFEAKGAFASRFWCMRADTYSKHSMSYDWIGETIRGDMRSDLVAIHPVDILACPRPNVRPWNVRTSTTARERTPAQWRWRADEFRVWEVGTRRRCRRWPAERRDLDRRARRPRGSGRGVGQSQSRTDT